MDFLKWHWGFRWVWKRFPNWRFQGAKFSKQLCKLHGIWIPLKNFIAKVIRYYSTFSNWKHWFIIISNPWSEIYSLKIQAWLLLNLGGGEPLFWSALVGRRRDEILWNLHHRWGFKSFPTHQDFSFLNHQHSFLGSKDAFWGYLASSV